MQIQHQLFQQYSQKMARVYINPELQKLEKQGIDSYFELHVGRQQNPKDPRFPDIEPFGTCFIDFTKNFKIGLFFANYHRQKADDGALFIVRQTAIGNAPKNILFKEILLRLKKMIQDEPNKAYGSLPLLIFPEKQLYNLLDPKRSLQEAVYFAQLDFIVDLELSWADLAQNTEKQVFVKFILPKQSSEEVNEFLKLQGITEEYLFPKTIFDKK